MGNLSRNRTIAICSIIAGLTSMASPSWGQWRPKDTEWPTYTADLAGSKYRPLDQINASNFNKLEVAWRFKTDNMGWFHATSMLLASGGPRKWMLTRGDLTDRYKKWIDRSGRGIPS